MPLVKMTQECYDSLDKMKKQVRAQKEKKGLPLKTTFSECICALLRETGRLK